VLNKTSPIPKGLKISIFFIGISISIAHFVLGKKSFVVLGRFYSKATPEVEFVILFLGRE
jgi:hypothetical protein